MLSRIEGGSADGLARPGYRDAAEKIVALITAAGLQPGDRLPVERDLTERLGIGRSVLREALKVLAAAGILYTRQGSGIYLAREPHPFATAVINLSMPVDPEHMRSLFEFRTILETHAAQLAAERITHRELRALEEAVALNRQGAESGQIEQFAQGDTAFHLGIAGATRNPFLAESIGTVSRLQDRALEIVRSGPPGSRRIAAEQHATILSAIRDGRPAEAGAAMDTHIQTVLAAYQAELRRRITGLTSSTQTPPRTSAPDGEG